jgi:hypothetical protein
MSVQKNLGLANMNFFQASLVVVSPLYRYHAFSPVIASFRALSTG